MAVSEDIYWRTHIRVVLGELFLEQCPDYANRRFILNFVGTADDVNVVLNEGICHCKLSCKNTENGRLSTACHGLPNGL